MSRAKSSDRVEELDILKLDWKHTAAREEQVRDLRWQLQYELQNAAASNGREPAPNKAYKVCEVVTPLPSWKRLSEEAHRRATVAARGDQQGEAEEASAGAANFLPMPTVWSVRPFDGNIDICDAVSGVPLQTIRQAKAGILPTALRHAPHCTVMSIESDANIFYGSPLARKNAFEQQLLHLTCKQKVDTDFVWIGFADGTIRLVQSRGHRFNASNLKSKRHESDCFMVHELPKWHNAEIAALEISPFHPARETAARDLSKPFGYADAKSLMVASDLLPPDRQVHYLCSASADSCVVVWDLTQVYRAVSQLLCDQRHLEAQNLKGASVGAKGPRVHSAALAGMKRSSNPIYFDSFQFEGAEDNTLMSFCSYVSVKPLVRLKGSVCGLRHLRWVSTVVTTEGYKRPRPVAASTRDATADGHDAHKSANHQSQTCQDAREAQKRLLGLSEEAMCDAENELARRNPTVVEEPIASKSVHLLIAGDANGYVMIWNLVEELNRKYNTTSTTNNKGNGLAGGLGVLSQQLLDRNNKASNHRNSPPQKGGFLRRADLDVRSLASHMTSTATYLRSTDQKIQFSGGVSISGLEPLLPPVIRITLRRAEPRSRAPSPGACEDEENIQVPRDASLENEFMPLTDSVALFHAYEHLEIFVAVDGSVQFLSCHPAQLTRESEEQLYKLLEQNHNSPSRIETRRGLNDEVVGSLDFHSFSVFFSKRILQYRSQPITAMRLDPQRSELWVARHDGMMSCFSTTLLKVLCRIPHPHANETIGPPMQEEVSAGLVEYHSFAGQPVHLDMHPDCIPYAPSYVRSLRPTDTETGDRIMCLFGPEPRNTEEYVHFTTMSEAVGLAVERTEDMLATRLQQAYGFYVRRLAERRASKEAHRGVLLRSQRKSNLMGRLAEHLYKSATRCNVLRGWLTWVSERRAVRHAGILAQYHFRVEAAHMKWHSVVEGFRQDRGVVAQYRSDVLGLQKRAANVALLRRYLLEWHAIIQAAASNRLGQPILTTRACTALVRGYFHKWATVASDVLRSNRFARQQTRFQLSIQRNYTRDIVHAAFMRWMQGTLSKRRMVQWSMRLGVCWLRGCAVAASGRRQQRAFTTWRRAAQDIKYLGLQQWQKGKLHSAQAATETRQQLHIQHRIICDLAYQWHLLEQQYTRMEGDHFLAASHLLAQSFDAPTVLSIEFLKSGTFDDVINDTKAAEDHRITIWTAIERLRCDASHLKKEQHVVAAQQIAVEREEAYVMSLATGGPDEGASRDLLMRLRTLAAKELVQQSLNTHFPAITTDPASAFPELSKCLPRMDSIEACSVDELTTSAVNVLKSFVTPHLEQIAVFTESSSTLAVSWRGVVTALDALDYIEACGADEGAQGSGAAGTNGSPSSGEVGSHPLRYFSLAATVAENAAALQKFLKLSRKIVDRSVAP